MTLKQVTIARAYSLEGHDELNQALNILRDEEKYLALPLLEA